MSECLNQPKYKPLSARILRCVLGCRTQPHKWELRFAFVLPKFTGNFFSGIPQALSRIPVQRVYRNLSG